MKALVIMAALLATQLNDLVQTTLRNLGKPKFTSIAAPLQKYVAMRNLLRKNRIEFQSGYGAQWDVQVDHSHSSEHTGLGAVDHLEIVDTMVQAQADWRNTTSHYSFIGQEMDMNREPARIVNLVQERRIACMISLSILMEDAFFGVPVAITDTVTPWGINTWLQKNASEGFNGGAPSGYTTIGLNPTTYPNWKNYTFQYTLLTLDDFIRKLRKACTFTKFDPPVDGIPTFNTGDDYMFMTNYSVLGPLEEALTAQNEDLGSDIASQDGKVLLYRRPVMWIPRLEADTTGPFFGINWGVFKTMILSGWWLKETPVPVYPGQHTVSAHFLDSTYQWIMHDRRCDFVGATAATYPG